MPAPVPAPKIVQPVDVPERLLRYFITVQRYRNGKKYKDPYQLAKEVVFEADDRILV